MTVISGIVNPPSNTSIADGTQTNPLLQGKQGELLASEIHGKWFTQAYRGKLFIASTALAGTTIPVNASNLVSTFTLWNPLGSGVNLEMVEYNLNIAGTTTAVIGGINLVYQAGVGASIVIPTSQTALTPVAGMVGSNSAPQAKAFSAATLTGTPTVLMGLGLSFGTTGAAPGPTDAVYNFDGKLIIPPGVLITTVGVAAQTQPMGQTFVWIENPI